MINTNKQTTTKTLAEKAQLCAITSLNRLAKQLNLGTKSTKNALNRAVAKGMITYRIEGRKVYLMPTKLATIALN